MLTGTCLTDIQQHEINANIILPKLPWNIRAVEHFRLCFGIVPAASFASCQSNGDSLHIYSLHAARDV